MSEEYVSRNEFNTLKNEVQEIKIEMNENKDILQAISRKCDVITERLENTSKISDLQNENIETRITSKLEPIKKDIASNKKDIDEINDNRYYDDNMHGNMGYRENYRDDYREDYRDDYREDYRDDYRNYRDYDYRRDYDRRGGKINNRYKNYRNYRGGDYYEELEMVMDDMKETSRKIEDIADMANNQQDKNMLMKIAQKEKENHSYIKSLVEK